MPDPDQYSFERYLRAKRPVDERARDRRVRGRFRDALCDVGDPVRICEVGAGTGALVEAAVEWVPGDEVRYTAIETDPELVAAAVESVAEAASEAGRLRDRSDGTVVIDRPGGGRFVAEFVAADAFAYLEATDRRFDALVAQAFLDLTDPRTATPTFFEVLAPGGLAYFPITFDGVTALIPRVDPALDERIERRYHRHMETTEKAGGTTGDSRAGRHLLTAVPAAGGEVLAAGGSDWVVRPSAGEYPGDEAYLLHHLVDTIEGALAGDDAIDRQQLADWARTRHDQVDDGELVFLTHQLDVLARGPTRDG